jgi:hypothetical protein
MTKLLTVPKATARGLMMTLMVTLGWLSPACAQKTTTGADEKSFKALVSKYKSWKVDSAWGRVSQADQENYEFALLATVSFSPGKFDAVDKKGKHTKGTLIKGSYNTEKGVVPSVGFTFSKQARDWLIASTTTGPKPYIILYVDVCSDGCDAWYRLKPK